ncbi:MAG: Mur ligase domain-containing protein [Thermodesulfobacteriota bacterium]
MSYKPKYKNVYFTGVAGTGMSGLAQFHVMCGGLATGSDRAIDRGTARDIAEKLTSAGVKIVPQDGIGLTKKFDLIVVSTAIEDGVPEVQKAKELGIPLIHRSEYLAEITREYRTISVAGTSGKSTVAAMVFDILDCAGVSPSILTGANLVSLEKKSLLGNCFIGTSEWLVIEADESDGSLVRYSSEIGVLLNLDRDHKEPEEVKEYFSAFKSNSSLCILNGDKEGLADLREGATLFHTKEATDIVLEPDSSSFHYKDVEFDLPIPGLHNIENGVAATAVCAHVGVKPELCSTALKDFKGVTRRFQRVGAKRNIRVIDDFAHNPVKVAAAIKAAKLAGGRVLAFFQPHGFGPTRFMKDELIESFTDALNEEDILFITEIYYAGGTTTKDISSKEIADGIVERGREARFTSTRVDIIAEIISTAKEGDTILVMGARDPSLHKFATDILESL